MLNKITQIESTANCLYTQKEVESAIDNMADKINLLLKDKNPIFLCVLNGGIVISGKLLTRLNFPLTLDAINASRYLNETSGTNIQWLLKPKSNLQNRTVLIVDDILDEGLTLEAIVNYCKDQGASSIYTAVLANKKLDHKKPISADFVGLEVENSYVFGFGMDYKGYLRNSSGIYACKQDLI
ncbi:MAG: hypoxanthine-guanine phosphoribosyltransferase [Methylococcales bacterium]|nr:hypoxanthine-guanine phosphoribosyltransferase [Methylococcales bacterium]